MAEAELELPCPADDPPERDVPALRVAEGLAPGESVVAPEELWDDALAPVLRLDDGLATAEVVAPWPDVILTEGLAPVLGEAPALSVADPLANGLAALLRAGETEEPDD